MTLGKRVPRIEDPALLRGRACFVDDLRFPDLLHAVFVRSGEAHARVRGIDISTAMTVPGVRAVLTLDDLRPHVTRVAMPLAQPSGAIRHVLDPPILADGEVRYVGEPVAAAIADSPYRAEDAAALVEIDYEPLPASIDCRRALEPAAPPAHSALPDNLVAALSMAYGDCDRAFASAAHTVRADMHQNKGLGHAIECRGLLARLDPNDGKLTVWSGTQMPHRAHAVLCDLLGRGEDRLRVIAPDVGGGFGPKFVFYAEEAVVALAACIVGRPVKWIEDRREHFTATTQERDQFWDMEMALDAEGRILGIRGTLIHDHGAYSPYGVNLPYNSATNLLGPYAVPAYSLDIRLAATNKVPVTPVRGAGRPQGTFVMERLLDRAASLLGIGRTEIRRRNLIGPEAMPYVTPVKNRDGTAMTYDSGDYPATQVLALEASEHDAFRARQAALRREGRYVGIGIGNYVEGTGRGPFESARIRINPSGRVTIATGATAQGQGLKTALAQVCASALGLDPGAVEVTAGDTGTVSLGLGAFASRQAVTAGSSVHVAASALADKALRAAAHMLEAAPDDLELAGGRVRVRGVPDMAVELGEIARALAGQPGYALPGGIEPGMEALGTFTPETVTYCNGCHVAEVEVDVETGAVGILRYTVVHDCGRMINPMIVDGQVIGGAIHGIGSALYERMAFDDAGQPMTVNLGECLMPGACEMPRLDLIHTESPTPLNPLGAKGAGEGGVIPAPAAIAAAVEDALAPFGVLIDDVPIAPDRIVAAVAAARR
ncbi:MAG: xanthine dehydrogenase family protein molybdopterin-binding subunit [Defluviicoccus sp.]|nr:xanthine dehydrogenase family protein molybdopterin-binding subunit [Defluviicoccus sp.]MDE0274327.1 xanthine dehydrogenase family protein molybdopterin-binding subunit [Defluviicoccus sp.]